MKELKPNCPNGKCTDRGGDNIQGSNLPFNKERKNKMLLVNSSRLIFVKQAAQLLGLSLYVTTKPGEIYTTNEGNKYPLDKSTFGVRIYFPKDGYGLLDFWKTVNLLEEEAKKEHQFCESIII